MGTRSLTFVYSENETPMLCLYRQYDGYVSGHGQELADFLKPFKVVNGLSDGETSFVANGMGCLAAQLVAHFKKTPGGFYIHPVDLTQDAWQEYEYHIFEDRIEVKNPNEPIFSGCWEEFYDFCYEKQEA